MIVALAIVVAFINLAGSLLVLRGALTNRATVKVIDGLIADMLGMQAAARARMGGTHSTGYKA